jgi:endonuclease YncB( thermonuclease family)
MRQLAIALVLLLTTSAASADTIAGHASVIDGDTIDIRDERIRILDVDAPESAQFCFRRTESLDAGAWPCGRQAALALSNWIGEQIVTCETASKDRNGKRTAPWPARI